MFGPALLFTAMAPNYAMRDISTDSLATPMDEQRLNIKFCVKLGKVPLKLTTQNSKCTVVKRYHVHVSEWHKCFHEGWETMEEYARSGCPSSPHTPENTEQV